MLLVLWAKPAAAMAERAEGGHCRNAGKFKGTMRAEDRTDLASTDRICVNLQSIHAVEEDEVCSRHKGALFLFMIWEGWRLARRVVGKDSRNS